MLPEKVITEKSEPYRSHVARRLVRSYNLPRGKDRFFLILRTILNLPKEVCIEYFQNTLIMLDLDDFLQRWLYCHNLGDDHDFSIISKILQAGDHFVDVGANIGIVTLIGSKIVGEGGKVYAIEALPKARAALQNNLELNSAMNVDVLPYALLDEDKEVAFFESTNGNMGGSSLSSSGKNGEAIMVQGRSFDSLFTERIIERCDVLKMDIEGAEILALRGMEGFFKRQKPRAVMTEISDDLLSQFSATPADVLEYFRRLGYEWFVAEKYRFSRVVDSDTRHNTNLWAILPGGISESLINS